MVIAVDENVAGAIDAFEQFGSVRTVAGRTLQRSDLEDVDALVVRSVTRVDASLLEGTPVRFVGTATIGTDHLDLSWLASARVRVADAAGCNSRSVAEYVVAALFELRSRGVLSIIDDSIGIIGMGRIGTIVSRMARGLGMRVVEHDPPRARREPAFASAPVSRVLGCRIVTVHVPLTIGCVDPTWHLVDAAFLERMREDALLVNTSRGSVVHREDLATALRRGLIAGAVLDVWEGEPEVPRGLIASATIATPHIAGYSLDGKIRATAMIADALARFLGVENRWRPETILEEPAGTLELARGLAPLDAAGAALRVAYDIAHDDATLREILGLEDHARRVGFDALRKHYPMRREAPAYTVTGATAESAPLLEILGFQVASHGFDD